MYNDTNITKAIYSEAIYYSNLILIKIRTNKICMIVNSEILILFISIINTDKVSCKKNTKI